MLAPRKRLLPVAVIVTLVIFLALNHREYNHIYQQLSSSININAAAVPDGAPANRTLGFGAVLVVSKEGSDRRHALLQAANVTDIDLTIPKQPVWTEGDVTSFKNGVEKSVQRGSILAWLGHRNALQWFLDSGLETALILEDDVDWDIRLRSVQIPLAASAARSMLPPPKSYLPSFNSDANRTQYWGDPKAWDLLYLGHCGDYFNEVTYEGLKDSVKGFNISDLPHVMYNDPSLPVKSDLHPFTQSLFEAINVPAHTRIFHRSKFPLCTFGYAVTRAAAERLLDDLAPAKLRPNGPKAFDVAILHACNKGSGTPSPTPKNNPKPHPDPKLRYKYASPGIRCWTLNSELFHHMPGHSQIAKIDEDQGRTVGIPPVDFAGQTQIEVRNETTNIGCGFWGGAFAFDNEDTARLKFLQEEVGRKGKCLKEGKDSL
ncbi:hypothetical protein BCR34DRAFT_481549 [Clohesyomyces aquaticus]|uniref:Glycosyltransferase family 25 protein n=1 Tax=Clohesyomyces aquaticus TaxID=1231657 RepID=A0A1Y1ZSC3_9PLEO|nr:hypothetical protein BCR34DRAFT_481549 [Clohesyomyces aquaticus]